MCWVRLLAVINLWWSVMIMCCEVHVLTFNYVLSCWSWGDAGLSGCAGVVVGVGVGKWEWGMDLC